MAAALLPRPRLTRRSGAVVAAVGVLAAGGALVGATDGGAPAPRIASLDLEAPSLPLPVDDASTPAPAATDGDAAAAEQPAARKVRTTTTRRASETLPSGAPTDAQIKSELAEASGGKSTSVQRLVSSATLTSDGYATIPPDAPPKVAAIIQGGNAVAKKPYVYGGGHGRLAGSIWSDSAYDCSGSVSYALAAAGLLNGPMTSGALADWKGAAKGPGTWVTIYANGGHTFMYVAGLRFDTSGRSSDRGSRWQTAPRSLAGFTVVHPKGL